MDLHRAEKQPDWNSIPIVDMNVWQRVATRTDGWITPGNAVTIGGNVAAFSGLQQIMNGNTANGLIWLAAGRVADLLDGAVAHRTGTKGPKGEALDAGFDKLQAAATIGVFAANDLMPDAALWAAGTQQGLMAAAAVVAKARNVELHPGQVGKLATFAMWGTVIWYPTSELTSGFVSEASEVLAQASLAATIALGAAAIVSYGRQAFSKHRNL